MSQEKVVEFGFLKGMILAVEFGETEASHLLHEPVLVSQIRRPFGVQACDVP